MKAALRRICTYVLLAGLVLGAVPAASSASVADQAYRYTTRWPQPTWHLKKPTGVAVDKDGNAYVVEHGNDLVRGDQVQKFDAAGAFVLKWGSTGSDDGAFKSPTGIAVDSTRGYVYVADTENHRIQKFTLDGRFLAKWGRSGSPDFWGSAPGEFNSPTGVAVDESGNVYVCDKGNNRIQKFTSAGGFLKQWGSPGSNDDQFLEPRGIAVDGDGYVYVIDGDRTNSRVQKFDSEGRFVQKWGAWDPTGEGKGLFRYPSGIAVDGDGYVYVADTNGHRVQKFSSVGLFVTQWGLSWCVWGIRDGEYRFPYGIATDWQNNVWVADTENDRVQKLSPAGVVLAVQGSYSLSLGRFRSPGDVAVAPSGDVYVADTENYRIQHFTATGGYVGWWGNQPTNPPVASLDNGKFSKPYGIAVDDDGSVYVADTNNHRIQKFDAIGNYLTKWGEQGTANGYFRYPRGVTAQGSYVYVADTGNDRIQKFDKLGYFVQKWGSTGSADGQFSRPSAVAVDRAGNVYVADTGNKRVQKFAPSGAFLRTWGVMGTGASQFNEPSGIEIDSDGNVLVSDTNNDRVEKFSPDGAFLLAWGTPGTQPGEFSRPCGLAASPDGHVFVADRDNHRIQSFLLVTPIRITVTGVADGGHYRTAVTPGVVISGPVANSSILMNGVPWTEQTVYSDDGTYRMDIWAEDSQGNETTATITFDIDRTPPRTVSNARDSYDNAASIGLTATDNLSGVAQTFYSLDGAAPVSGASVSVQRWGSHTLTYWSTDRAGNEEAHHTEQFEVRDTVAPVTAHDAVASYGRVATIRLSPADAGSGVAHTYCSLDGAGAIDARAVSTSALGTHTLQFRSVDVAGNSEASHTVMFTVNGGAVQVEPVQGGNRFDTAVAASQHAFPSGADEVVITTGWNWPDALGGSALAGALDGPILLTNRDSLPVSVVNELTRLGAKRATILGSQSAVSGAVESYLKNRLGTANVRRIGGTTRYDTAKLIAAEVASKPGYGRVAFVATGLNYPDALAASPLASARRWPIYLTPQATIPQATIDAMRASGVTDVLILGGTPAVSNGVQATLESAFGATHVQRLEGSNRYATAVTVASYGVQQAGLVWDGVALATGQSFPDGLSGGILQGKSGSVLLLTPPDRLDPAPEAALIANRASIGTVRYLGSTAAVGQPVRDRIAQVLQH